MRRVLGVLMALACARFAVGQQNVSLNGPWHLGVGRVYSHVVQVPGLAGDPGKEAEQTLWFKREVHLPGGDWTQATLTLNGARFDPQVWVDGEKVSEKQGGMAPTVHLLRSTHVKPGATVTLEIALRSLHDVDAKNASLVPPADSWRTDISSSLWDSVTLHVAGANRLVRVTPFTDFARRKLAVHWATEEAEQGAVVRAEIVNAQGRVLANGEGRNGVTELTLRADVKEWSPEEPVVYTLRTSLLRNGRLLDRDERNWGLKSFSVEGKRFVLNGHPEELRGGTFVWHRFLRNPDAREVAFEPEWFQRNVLLRLKGYGANFIRWHIGSPPEALLDLCDRDGLAVQLEWPFFHGVKASDASLREQWTAWMDLAMRHPSVSLLQPWNETQGPDLEPAWKALEGVLADYPPMVVAHRDTLHIHKYWWSLFENLGLYYDSAEQFPKAIMVDEFGGDYLDQRGNAGAYPTACDSFLRFLGRKQSVPMRLEFQAEANARVAEYWRRIGAAGFSPFTIAGSLEDGDSWFLGPMQDPKPMPVWDAMAAAWSPQSVSLNVWDRNYLPGQKVTLPVVFFNDETSPAELVSEVEVRDATGKVVSSTTVRATVPAEGRVTRSAEVVMPAAVGAWQFRATLRGAVKGVQHPIASWWDVRTLNPHAARTTVVGIATDEAELQAFATESGLTRTGLEDPAAKVLLLSKASWARLAGDAAFRALLKRALDRGQSVVMLDVGPQDLGVGYAKGDQGPLEGAPRVRDPYIVTAELFGGAGVAFRQVAEPESHVQTGPENESLWRGMPVQATWLWNGLRGGLVAPAAEMEISGLSREAVASQWVERGADAAALKQPGYTAYRLAGYYAFSTHPDDKAVMDALRKKVKFLVEDAPALQDSINPKAKVQQIDLAGAYAAAPVQGASRLTVLATAGKGLTRAVVEQLEFGPGKGRVILSQLLTAGRLDCGVSEPGEYGIRYDPAAEQIVLNMLALATGQ